MSICWLLLHMIFLPCMIFLLHVKTGFLLMRKGVVLHFHSYRFCPHPAFTEIGRENVYRYLGTRLIKAC